MGAGAKEGAQRLDPTTWGANQFDDSTWSRATSYGPNSGDNGWQQAGGGPRPDISGEAQWLWTANEEADVTVYCRYKPPACIPDPTPGCPKDFYAKWRCEGDGNDRLLSIPAEAGFGSILRLAILRLACDAPPSAALALGITKSQKGLISGFAGTHGMRGSC